MWDYFQENKNKIFSDLLLIYLGQLLNRKYPFQGTRCCLRAKCSFRCKMDKSNSAGLQVSLTGFPEYLQEDQDAHYSLHEKSILANKEKYIFSLFLFPISDVLDHAEAGLVPRGEAIYAS